MDIKVYKQKIHPFELMGSFRRPLISKWAVIEPL